MSSTLSTVSRQGTTLGQAQSKMVSDQAVTAMDEFHHLRPLVLGSRFAPNFYLDFTTV